MVRGVSVKSVARKGRLEEAGNEVRVIGGRVSRREMVVGREPEEAEEGVREVESSQGGDQMEAESGEQVGGSVEEEREEAGGVAEAEEAVAETVDRQMAVVNMEVVWRWLYDRG